MKPDVSETTQLLLDWADGDENALPALTSRIYGELRAMAAAFVRHEREQHTLQPTALVHEVYLRLVDVQSAGWKGKAHFYGACAQIMRRILVDAARRRSALRRGGGLARVDLADIPDSVRTRDSRLIALDEALNQLRGADPRKARVVELRYFGGLSVAEMSAVLKVSEETVSRDWRLARGWLLAEVSKSEAGKAAEYLRE